MFNPFSVKKVSNMSAFEKLIRLIICVVFIGLIVYYSAPIFTPEKTYDNEKFFLREYMGTDFRAVNYNLEKNGYSHDTMQSLVIRQVNDDSGVFKTPLIFSDDIDKCNANGDNYVIRKLKVNDKDIDFKTYCFLDHFAALPNVSVISLIMFPLNPVDRKYLTDEIIKSKSEINIGEYIFSTKGFAHAWNNAGSPSVAKYYFGDYDRKAYNRKVALGLDE